MTKRPTPGTPCALSEEVTWLREAVAAAELVSETSFLITGPSGFEASAWTGHVAPTVPPGLVGMQSDTDRALAVIDALPTGTPLVVALWKGVEQPALAHGEWMDVDVSIREYAMRIATRSELESIASRRSWDLPPALVWPLGHEWIQWSDIDLTWTGLAAPRAAIERLCTSGLAFAGLPGTAHLT